MCMVEVGLNATHTQKKNKKGTGGNIARWLVVVATTAPNPLYCPHNIQTYRHTHTRRLCCSKKKNVVGVTQLFATNSSKCAVD